ncbi:hypothetical protein [Kibdelosporangium persicum]|uniref:hypothetical protein n=2 Tax=Kibdelosporangium persicum TaxID=2698649 RepID=UPI0039EDEF88
MFVLTVASCSAGPRTSATTAQAPPTVVSTSSASSASDHAKSQAVAAYRDMWQAMAKAAETADAQSPELAKYATGDALGVLNRSLYADRLNGVVSKGRPTNNPTVSTVDPTDKPTTVAVADCSDSSNWLKYKGGKLLDDTPGGRRSITAEVKKQQDGTWKVTRFAVEKVGSC